MSNLLKTCPACKGLPLNPDTVPGGEGQNPQLQVCAYCNGALTVPGGVVVDDDIIDKLNDILNKCNDILEQVTL